VYSASGRRPVTTRQVSPGVTGRLISQGGVPVRRTVNRHPSGAGLGRLFHGDDLRDGIVAPCDDFRE
jgi:hypothetical protein